MDRYSETRELFEAGKRAGIREMWWMLMPAVVGGMFLGFWLVSAFGVCK